jgi:hypothetical protein
MVSCLAALLVKLVKRLEELGPEPQLPQDFETLDEVAGDGASEPGSFGARRIER